MCMKTAEQCQSIFNISGFLWITTLKSNPTIKIGLTKI